MHSLKLLCAAPILAAAFAAATAPGSAQATPSQPVVAQATTAPEETMAPTLLDQQYDGQTHVMLAPYIWGPTIRGNFQFFIPTISKHHGKLVQNTVDVGPSNYLPKLNAAAMAAFDVRKGNFDLYGDAIYLNGSTTATIYSTITGPLGKVHIPVTFDSSARLASAIWEVAAGFTVARSHTADLSTFVGYRDFPIYLNVSYTATIGKRGIIAPSGTATPSDHAGDPIWGIRGRAFTDRHWYIPYYFDFGGGNNNQTWQAYGGGGYAFSHGQSLVLLYRQLDYYGFPATAHTQRLDLGGPLLGYTFNL